MSLTSALRCRYEIEQGTGSAGPHARTSPVCRLRNGTENISRTVLSLQFLDTKIFPETCVQILLACPP